MTASPTQQAVGSKQFATFYVGELLFGVDVMTVQEVIRFQEMTPVPLASPVIQGLINLRGQILTAIDLRRQLKQSVRAEGALPMNVVIRTDGNIVSLLVDEIGDVLEVDDKLFEDPPPTLDAHTRSLITGVYKLKDELLLVLNTVHAVDVKSEVH